ncbi:D-alanyl-D-alanine carboxypeptidase [Actinomadura barringtoniae]|uniref:D-alanyl-D-alanine carboxypeptidase n=1 Tax=Actinomadura barringtoniae TaxID=1427535 RepID=A0A939PBP9_9ACTN|nr:D-alanyl-D-alanine carboxypeptidase [Actinomadura barringtoniae]MBO2445531.1 D-alanyl-D-alanine carboxypeptidase [Actinomadura barringtoniae]
MDLPRKASDSGTGVRFGFRSPLAHLLVAAALLIPLAAMLPYSYAMVTGGRDTKDRRPGTSTMPWPDEGQSIVHAEGVGELGSSGDRKPVPIASLTKVMTAYVILKDHPLRGSAEGPAITVDGQAAKEAGHRDESTAPVREGQRFTERQLLYLMLLPSGNNVARLLARWDSGSQEAFVQKMNRAASALGMTDTRYTGASGYETDTRSTAADQLKLARRAMRDRVLRAIVATPSVIVPGIEGPVDNTNRLLGKSGVIGLKTGSSSSSGGCLMWAAHSDPENGRSPLIFGVVLGQLTGKPAEQTLAAAVIRSHRLVTAAQRIVAARP